jgi:UDP-N-acetylglucosamine 1-carboxyvinyltransferase
LLTPEKVTITNVPDIRDVNVLIDLIRSLGVIITNPQPNTFEFTAKQIDLNYLTSNEFSRKAAALRGSIMIIGPLLARFGKGFMPKPGGDMIGRRRLDTHFIGFEKLGASFNYDPDHNNYTVEAQKLKGTYMLLDEASVTGTANIIMAAVLAEGTTTIYNAACEPYI